MPKTSAEPVLGEIRSRLAALAQECRDLSVVVHDAWDDGRLRGAQWHNNGEFLRTLEVTIRCINTKEPTDEQDER